MNGIAVHYLRVILCALLMSYVGVERVGAAEDSDVNWASGGRAYDEQHFSPLKQITTNNVSKLALASWLDLPDEQSLEATPIAVDGVLYFSGQMSRVYAVEAASGRLLWMHDPQAYLDRPRELRYLFPVNRGVAYDRGKVFVGTLDGRLLAMDAKTGREVWSAVTLEPRSKRLITGAPRVCDGQVLIGNSGGDYGERGYLTAYNAETGKQTWRFYAAPGDPAIYKDETQAIAAPTWSGEWWKTGTGGTVWDSFTCDYEMDRVYIGTGNSGPYNPEVRSPGGGDNLFLASIVAVDAKTGAYRWHYQVNPRESWDWKATQNIVLATLTIEGRTHRVLMQSPTNGFLYVIDRDSGKLLSAGKTGKVTWADHIDLKTQRPVEAPNIRYQDGPITMWPSPAGTHNWQPMAFSPDTGLVYIPYMKSAAKYQLGGADGLQTEYQILKVDSDDGSGQLLAWDPVVQKPRWSAYRPRMWNGGVASTAGDLVFQGDADGIFHAYDARDGKALWTYDCKLGIVGAPITFMSNGTQYVSVLVGFGGGAIALTAAYGNYGWKYGAQPRRVLTFSLNGSAQLSPTPPRDFALSPRDDPQLQIDESAAAEGQRVFQEKFCATCHGLGAQGNGGPGPDLRESRIALNYPGFAAFIRSGAKIAHGMPKFDDVTDAEARQLFMYIRLSARLAKSGAVDNRGRNATRSTS